MAKIMAAIGGINNMAAKLAKAQRHRLAHRGGVRAKCLLAPATRKASRGIGGGVINQRGVTEAKIVEMAGGGGVCACAKSSAAYRENENEAENQ